MKKRLIIFSLVLILVFLSMVSAKYICSNNTEISRDSKEIQEGERKSINGLEIALIDSREHAVLKKVEAKLIIEAKKISFTNDSRSEKIEFSDGKYTAELLNATADSAIIKIGSSKEELDEGENIVLGGREIFLIESDKDAEGKISAEAIIGKEKIMLDSSEIRTYILDINNINYLIELFSGSSSSAIITVWKCKTGKIEEKKGIANATEEIEEGEEIINDTEQIENATEGIGGEEREEQLNDKKESLLKKPWFLFSSALIAILIIIYFAYKTIQTRI